MANILGIVYVQIKAAMQGLSTGLNQAKNAVLGVTGQMTQTTAIATNAVSEQFGQISYAIARINQPILQAIRSIRIMHIALNALNSFSDSTGVRLNTVLKNTGEAAGYSRDQIDKMSDYLSNTANATHRVSREALQVMLSFGAIRGDVFKGAVQALPDLAVALGQDLPHAARTLGKALQDPANALSNLEELGVTITPRMREMMARVPEGTQEDWLRAQQYILEAVTQMSSGGAEAMKDTLGGAISELNRRLGDAGDTIAESLVPAIKGISGFVKSITDAIADNQGAIEAFASAVGQVFQIVGDIVGTVIEAVGNVSEGFASFTGYITGVAVALAGLSIVVSVSTVFFRGLQIAFILVKTVAWLATGGIYALTTAFWPLLLVIAAVTAAIYFFGGSWSKVFGSITSALGLANKDMDAMMADAARKQGAQDKDADKRLGRDKDRRNKNLKDIKDKNQQARADQAKGGFDISKGGKMEVTRKDLDNFEAHPAPIPLMVKVKFEHVGFKELWAKVQDKMGTKVEDFNKMTAKGVVDLNNESKKQTKALDRIDKGIAGLKPGLGP